MKRFIIFILCIVGFACKKRQSLVQNLTNKEKGSVWLRGKLNSSGNLMFYSERFRFVSNNILKWTLIDSKSKDFQSDGWGGEMDVKWSYNAQDSFLKTGNVSYKVLRIQEDTILLKKMKSGEVNMLIRLK